ncbi:hypothetical protein CDL12_22375 [Handroanthus impetiginosus]|uniref:Uncharacterized protein n=1 Tax=Handroanthus impetiginosus TaxID=429701 RepID=A0A2G9GIG4_9LAMI|nr:hypothetical protein CDL12_22375 [Handroanthus impetiginosus]
MSLLTRAKLGARKCPFSLYSITALQQLSSYSTRTTHFSQKSQQLANPRAQKSSEPSANSSQRTKKQVGSLVVWPKPKEIPYQAKVANFVNLIGHVKTPVRFEASSDGKHFAITLISQENSGEKNSLLIPILFEGDLAHVVTCHVKENDCVFVSGPLSLDRLPFELGDSLGKFHIVAENLNFVEGFKRSTSSKKIGISFSSVEIEKPEAKKIEEVVKREENDDVFSKQWKDALRAKAESLSSEKKDMESSVMQESSNSPKLNTDVKTMSSDSVETKQEKANEKSVESAYKKKDGDQILDLWRDLLKNPLQWWDYRDHKSNGLVKEKFPDFKHKGTGDSLWLNTAPDWVLPGLGKLEFDVKVIRAKQVQGNEGSGQRKSDGKGEDSWRSLVEYPSRWWDNRVGKRYPKSPDFKHKETGEGLWVSDVPDWASSRLPPLKDGNRNMETVQSI